MVLIHTQVWELLSLRGGGVGPRAQVGEHTLHGGGGHFCRVQAQIDSWWMVVNWMEFVPDCIIFLLEIGSSFVYWKTLGVKSRIDWFLSNVIHIWILETLLSSWTKCDEFEAEIYLYSFSFRSFLLLTLSHQEQAVLLTGLWLPRTQTVPSSHVCVFWAFGLWFQWGFYVIVLVTGYFGEVAEITSFKTRTKKKIRARIHHTHMRDLQMIDFINTPTQKVWNQ